MKTTYPLVLNKIVSGALLFGGVGLFILGFRAANSPAPDVSISIAGAPNSASVWMLIGGTLAAVVGLARFLRGTKPAYRDCQTGYRDNRRQV